MHMMHMPVSGLQYLISMTALSAMQQATLNSSNLSVMVFKS
jgi:hypothetical protein